MDKNNKKDIEENSDDILFDSNEDLDDSIVAEESQLERIKKLQEKLKESELKAKQYLDGWQRAKAEFLNLRKRDEEEKRQRAKFAAEEVVLDIIPVLDNFGLAMTNKEAWDALPKDWRLGMESIFAQLRSSLETHGLVQYGRVGESFNPSIHEAIETIKTDNSEEQDQTIARVLQPGFMLHEKVVRPAKVSVFEK
jgi:molecular chaperone GrpE